MWFMALIVPLRALRVKDCPWPLPINNPVIHIENNQARATVASLNNISILQISHHRPFQGLWCPFPQSVSSFLGNG